MSFILCFFALIFLFPVSSSSIHPILLFLLLFLLLFSSRYLDSDSNDGDTGKDVVCLFHFISFCCITPFSSFLFICRVLILFTTSGPIFFFIMIIITIGVTQVCVCILFNLLFQTIAVLQILERSTSTALCHPAVPPTAQTCEQLVLKIDGK